MELDQLSAFVGSEARARLLAHFVARPESRLHVRALERDTGIGKRSLQKELARLVEMGLVRREHEGRRVVYVRSGYTPEWRAIEKLVATYGIPLLLRAGLAGVPGVEAAFIFGSLARGDARPDSDIDLLVYGEELGDSFDFLYIFGLLDRKLDDKWIDRERFLRWNDPRVSFLPSALRAPKIWLIGSENLFPQRERMAA
ncbi:nucleotidyltransferase domain-containing protein [Longimicrobium sp.]|uniref:nucleotidyltransferase domain-containing protein n=1 Tax=Longimicrobium sp. TaxID=2029185 RepID=UPI002BD330C8|nr:nucleotidyltransferase domain-containing protein [Longimicrobium sp.]HSU14216.1 nucleotidyltransferase domain-containing protein [Longimicrobium sp.]